MRRQNQALEPVDRKSKAYLEESARLWADHRLAKEAWEWYRVRGRDLQIRDKTGHYAAFNSAEHEWWLLPMYRAVLAEQAAAAAAAAAPSGSSAE